MRLLFLSTPQTAHLDWGGYLATAQRLTGRGHATLWASGASIAARMEQAGIPFAAVAETGWRLPSPLAPDAVPADPQQAAYMRQLRAFDTWLDVESVACAVESIEPIAHEFAPDAIITEMFCAAAAVVAERLQRPLIVAGWPAMDSQPSTSPLYAELRGRVDALTQRFGIAGRYFAPHMPALQSDHLHVTWWNERWYAGIPLLPQTRHAGGIAPAALPASPLIPDPEDRPWVFITLGTTYNRDAAFFRMATQAAVNMGCLPVVAHGALPAAEREALAAELPSLAYLTERVDFAAVLPYCAAAIHHGGAGTTHALVTHGIPQVVVPHAGDQGFQARAVARCGIGMHIPAREVTVDRLQSALVKLLPDRSTFRSNAVWLRKEFAELGGIETSANLIEGVVAGAQNETREG